MSDIVIVGPSDESLTAAARHPGPYRYRHGWIPLAGTKGGKGDSDRGGGDDSARSDRGGAGGSSRGGGSSGGSGGSGGGSGAARPTSSGGGGSPGHRKDLDTIRMAGQHRKEAIRDMPEGQLRGIHEEARHQAGKSTAPKTKEHLQGIGKDIRDELASRKSSGGKSSGDSKASDAGGASDSGGGSERRVLGDDKFGVPQGGNDKTPIKTGTVHDDAINKSLQRLERDEPELGRRQRARIEAKQRDGTLNPGQEADRLKRITANNRRDNPPPVRASGAVQIVGPRPPIRIVAAAQEPQS